MRKSLLILAFSAFLITLFGQSGLFDLYYDADIETAHEILSENGFELFDVRGNIGIYKSETNLFVDSILLLADIKTDTLVGWLVKYEKDNSAEQDSFVLDTIAKMYGETNHYDEDTDQLIWFLSDIRTVHVMYGSQDELIVLYYDARHPGLFSLDKK